MDDVRTFLRHTVATLAYRAGKVLRDAPPGLEALRIHESSRTPLQILAHVNDLFDWALALADGQHIWRDSKPSQWEAEVNRFFETLQRFDERLASDRPLESTAENLFQGPIADALSHVGQIAMLRRVAGQPVRPENYFKAPITAGHLR